jgi:hypothetical protein
VWHTFSQTLFAAVFIQELIVYFTIFF